MVLPYPMPKNTPFPITIDHPGRVTVHPGAELFHDVMLTTALTPGEIAQVTASTDGHRVYVFVKVTYKDIFGKQRETRACATVGDFNYMRYVFNPIGPHPEFGFHFMDQHNEAN